MDRIRSLLGRELPPRVGVVAAELARRRPARYLEIGVGTGVVFLHVRARRKVGVDPVARVPRWRWFAHPNALLRGSFFRATSDELFAALGPEERFDVIFVDGDHSFAQSLRDVESALDHLAKDGVVLVHDCSPPSAAAASRDSRGAGGGPWCGEVWRTIVHLRAARADLEVATIEADFGIGVIRRRSPARPPLAGVEVARLGYPDLEARRAELLGLRAGGSGMRATVGVGRSR